MADWKLTAGCWDFKHLWMLSETNALHADFLTFPARDCSLRFSGNACKLLKHAIMFGSYKAWSSIGILLLLLLVRSRRIRPLGVLRRCSTLFLVLVKALVPTIALALSKVRARGPGHLFLGHLLATILFATFGR